MSRNFTGTRGGGGSSGGGMLGIRSGSSSDVKVDKHNFYKLSTKARFQKIMWMKKEERIQAQMERMMEGKEDNKKVQQFMEMQKQKRAMKQKRLEKSQEMTVRAVNFNGGRVDGRGNIMDATGKVIGKIDMESKQISIGLGKLGKFKDTQSGIFALERAVQQYTLNHTKKPDNGSLW